MDTGGAAYYFPPQRFIQTTLQALLTLLYRGGAQVALVAHRLIAEALDNYAEMKIRRWPRQAPDSLGPYSSRFIGIEIGNQTIPAILQDKASTNRSLKMLRQREAVVRADAVYNQMTQECQRRETFLRGHASQLEKTVNRLREHLADRGPDNDSWTSEDERYDKEYEKLRGEFDRAERLREDVLQERAMLATSMLHYFRTFVNENLDAREDLQTHLKQEGLLQYDKTVFWDTWNRLPLKFREAFGRRGRIECDGPNYDDGRFARDWQSRISAEIAYESALQSLEAERFGLFTHDKQHKLEEENHGKARVAGRDIPTLSEFDRECLERGDPHLHRLAECEADVGLAAGRLLAWEELENLDPNGFVVCKDSLADTESERSANGEIHQAFLGERTEAFISKWEDNTESGPILDGDAESLVDPAPSIILPGPSIKMDDSQSIFEHRIYESVRAQQWFNMQQEDYAQFAIARSRVPATVMPIVSQKRGRENGPPASETPEALKLARKAQINKRKPSKYRNKNLEASN